MVSPSRSPKRRKLSSSPDELGDAHEHDYSPTVPRRKLSSSQLDTFVDRTRKPYGDSRANGARLESPDELMDDVRGFWRNRRSRSTSLDRSHSRRRDDVSPGGSRERDQERRPRRRSRSRSLSRPRTRDEAMMDRSSVTPIARPPSPPTKATPPTRLFYKEKAVLKGHNRGVAAVKFSPDGQWIASCSADATIRIWESATGRHLRTLEGHLAGISTIAWSPDSRTLASGSDDKSIRLWDALKGKAYPKSLVGHHNYVYSIAFSPKGNMLVSGSYDEAVYLWDVRSARIMRQLPAHSDPVSGVDFIRDGTLIVSCARDGLIRIWDTSTGQCLRTIVHEDNPPVSAVLFSPNGNHVLAWTLDSCVRLWDYIEGRCVKTYQGHKNDKYSTCGTFGTYGHSNGVQYAFAASGSEDGAVVIWDVSGKNVLQRLEGHKGVVLGVDALIGSHVMVTCGLDRTVRIWEVDEAAQAAAEANTIGGEQEVDRTEETEAKDEAVIKMEEDEENDEGKDEATGEEEDVVADDEESESSV